MTLTVTKSLAIVTVMLVGLLAACDRPAQSPGAIPSVTSPALPVLTSPLSETNTATLGAIDANWYVYTAPDNRYQVRFPGKPTKETSTLELDTGKVVLTLVVYDDSQHQRAYAVSHSPVGTLSTPEEIDRRLAASQANMAKAVAAEVETWAPIIQDGYPGREFTLRKAGNYAAKAKVVYAQGVLYQAIALTYDEKNLNQLEIAAFLESFYLLPQP
ncbi:MAG: hypothetical protein NZ772_00675 [Cyanobacteria bacterium]|nr:hypothetical protein [Cyanobacteriota bacterium]MDW8199886.1 hypothetical protein [Cyanobacteriota bacterium SKYGB_h_bin112]